MSTTAETFRPLADPDPATPGEPFSRLHYHYGQLLGADDFAAEQRYFLLRSRLHNALLHGYGTVWGLRIRAEITPDPVRARLICEPGLAIDPLGREVFVPEALCLDLSGLPGTPLWVDLEPPARTDDGEDDRDDDRRQVYVVLEYQACLAEPVPVIAPPCGDRDDGLIPSRVLDRYRLCLAAGAPADPPPTARDITARTTPAALRARLLEHLLTPPPGVPLARFWSGADEAPLLLATVDLTVTGPRPGRVTGAVVDNGVRALLPAVQALTDLALGLRLEGPVDAFQAADIGITPVAGGGMALHIRLTRPVQPASVVDGSLKVLRFDPAATPPGWVEAPLKTPAADAEGVQVIIPEDWPDAVAFQVWLAGTGPTALLDTADRVLAGVAGEVPPAAGGRDAWLAGRYEPAG